MTEPPDYAALARQYLDLWEEHLTAIANDPALAKQMSATFGLMGQMMPLAMPGAVPPAGTADPFAALRQAMAGMNAAAASTAGAARGKREGDDKVRPDSRPAAGTAAAAAAPGDGDERLDELTQRLAALEERLDALAAGSGRSRERSAAKPAAKPAAGNSGTSRTRKPRKKPG